MDIFEEIGITGAARQAVESAEKRCAEQFAAIEQNSLECQAKVLSAFWKNNVALRHFAPTTGYGYGDEGRDKLDEVFADALGAEDALVRPQLASGTHALFAMLSGLLNPGDTLLAVSGKPYDTLEEAIGISGCSPVSLKAQGVTYAQIELNDANDIDVSAVLSALTPTTKIVYIQRSRGYAWREALSIESIERVTNAVKQSGGGALIAVDNCYGEFTQKLEPVQVGADIMAGSLIKNPGGGIAPGGGYIAGKKALIQRVAERLTSPGIGREAGSYAASYAPFFQGLFLAPHTVAQSLKGAVLASALFEAIGCKVSPAPSAYRGDIIQAIEFGEKERLIDFCEAVQASSPVDSFARPEPWDMPGYQHQVIMAAGAFVQGASIELSADAPIKPPYIAYMQGGLTYEHVKLALMRIASRLII